ncbi:MAG: hypothetical protein HY320_01025 [Armatimonadetes bacterium]|nr:hypothetical protein [Armatimonadota bacterium]
MSVTIRARFDGRVIIPEEPVDLPIDQPLVVELTPVPREEEKPSEAVIRQRLRRLEEASGRISAPPIPAEALCRENLYDERI